MIFGPSSACIEVRIHPWLLYVVVDLLTFGETLAAGFFQASGGDVVLHRFLCGHRLMKVRGGQGQSDAHGEGAFEEGDISGSPAYLCGLKVWMTLQTVSTSVLCISSYSTIDGSSALWKVNRISLLFWKDVHLLCKILMAFRSFWVLGSCVCSKHRRGGGSISVLCTGCLASLRIHSRSAWRRGVLRDGIGVGVVRQACRLALILNVDTSCFSVLGKVFVACVVVLVLHSFLVPGIFHQCSAVQSFLIFCANAPIFATHSPSSPRTKVFVVREMTLDVSFQPTAFPRSPVGGSATLRETQFGVLTTRSSQPNW